MVLYKNGKIQIREYAFIEKYIFHIIYFIQMHIIHLPPCQFLKYLVLLVLDFLQEVEDVGELW